MSLHKSLYDLKQAPRCWFAKLANALLDYGFTQCGGDNPVFLLIKGEVQLHILVYVDDLVLKGSSTQVIQK